MPPVRIPPLVVLLGFGTLAALLAFAFRGLTVDHAARYWLAGACLVTGIAISLLGVVSFRRARTTVNPLVPGNATALVVSGIYRVTRNPMYVGFVLLLLGEIVWLGNAVAFLAAPLFVAYLDKFQIRPEESALRALFGTEYVSYAARVRRWI